MSNVAFPSPHGHFLVETLSFFVGSAIGPLRSAPVLLATPFTAVENSFILPMSVLAILIRASVIFCFFVMKMQLMHLVFSPHHIS